MKLRFYQHGPKKTGGYLGWVESKAGSIIAFVRADGSFQFDW
jgi:hypothetical protein